MSEPPSFAVSLGKGWAASLSILEKILSLASAGRLFNCSEALLVMSKVKDIGP